MNLFDFLPHEQGHELIEYLPKQAAEVGEENNRSKHLLKTILQEVGGMGLGTLAGAGTAHYLEKAHRHFTSSPELPQGKPFSPAVLLTAAPILGAGLGLAYNMAKSRQQKQLPPDLPPPQEQ
jgi:hypothetical protein